jgi:hypothetical protein
MPVNVKGVKNMVKEYEPIYTVKEVAKILRTNSQAVYRLIGAKKLPGLRLGAIKVRGKDLEHFIEQYPVMDPDTENSEMRGGETDA